MRANNIVLHSNYYSSVAALYGVVVKFAHAPPSSPLLASAIRDDASVCAAQCEWGGLAVVTRFQQSVCWLLLLLRVLAPWERPTAQRTCVLCLSYVAYAIRKQLICVAVAARFVVVVENQTTKINTRTYDTDASQGNYRDHSGEGENQTHMAPTWIDIRNESAATLLLQARALTPQTHTHTMLVYIFVHKAGLHRVV